MTNFPETIVAQKKVAKRAAEGSRADRYLIECGAMTDAIAKAFPDLRPVADLHLADEDGAPMHAVANGWYWYSDYDGRGTRLYPHQEPLFSMVPRERAAHYLRIDSDEMPAGLDKEQFAEFVETLRPRWKEDAERALELLR